MASDEYVSIGMWFAVPVFLIVWVGCIIYAADQYGWFLGIPAGVFIGGFFAFIASAIALYLWPLIALAIVFLVYAIFGDS